MFGKAKLEYDALIIRDYIFGLYIILFLAIIYSNKVEEQLIIEEGKHNPEISHEIRLLVFGTLIIIYAYFVYRAYKLYEEDPKDKNALLELIAALLFLIAGIIFFYLETQAVVNENVEDGGISAEDAGAEV